MHNIGAKIGVLRAGALTQIAEISVVCRNCYEFPRIVIAVRRDRDAIGMAGKEEMRRCRLADGASAPVEACPAAARAGFLDEKKPASGAG
jgi:hypothetical protein